jgi:hypothetical protein
MGEAEMMEDATAIAAVGHSIQFPVAPVFPLSGIGAMLSAMTNRLSRNIDRIRQAGPRLARTPDSPDLPWP